MNQTSLIPRQNLSPLEPAEGAVTESSSVLTEGQALWITFRIESSSDRAATERYNKALGEELALTDAEVDSWRSDAEFCNFLSALPSGKKRAFEAMTEHLFPAAYRAIFLLLTGKSDWARKNGTELLLKLHGMLVERVKHDDGTQIEALVRVLREQSAVPMVRVLDRKPELTPETVEGQFRQVGSTE